MRERLANGSCSNRRLGTNCSICGKELKRVHQLAEQVDNGTIADMINMAIVEASAKVGASNDNVVRSKITHQPRVVYHLAAGMWKLLAASVADSSLGHSKTSRPSRSKTRNATVFGGNISFEAATPGV